MENGQLNDNAWQEMMMTGYALSFLKIVINVFKWLLFTTPDALMLIVTMCSFALGLSVQIAHSNASIRRSIQNQVWFALPPLRILGELAYIVDLDEAIRQSPWMRAILRWPSSENLYRIVIALRLAVGACTIVLPMVLFPVKVWRWYMMFACVEIVDIFFFCMYFTTTWSQRLYSIAGLLFLIVAMAIIVLNSIWPRARS